MTKPAVVGTWAKPRELRPPKPGGEGVDRRIGGNTGGPWVAPFDKRGIRAAIETKNGSPIWTGHDWEDRSVGLCDIPGGGGRRLGWLGQSVKNTYLTRAFLSRLVATGVQQQRQGRLRNTITVQTLRSGQFGEQRPEVR